MDLHTPLDPNQFANLRVGTMQRTERTTPYLCCVCHERQVARAGFRHEVVCNNPVCRDLAVLLEWVVA